MIKKTYTKLTNGLPLLIIEIPHAKSCAVTYWSKAGTRFNPEGKEGLAHFLEHLLLKKTKKYDSNEKLARVLESVGASTNGWTGREGLTLYVNCATKDFERSISVLSEMVRNPLIDKDSILSERKVIEKEIARKQSRPDDLIWELWFKLFFNNSPLEHPNLGTKESINKLIRSDFINYWKNDFRTKDSLLAIAGGIKFKDVLSKANKYFSKDKLKEKKVPTFNYKKGKSLIIKKMDLPQSSLLISFRTFGGPISKETYPLIMLRIIIGSGWSSRITQRLRIKESLIYGWGTNIARYYDTGSYTIRMGTEKNKIPKLTSILGEELRKIIKEGITEDELKLYKGYITGSMLAGMQTPWDYLNYYAADELYDPGTIESVEERVKNINKITRSQVNDVARKYLREDNWYMALVGDNKPGDIDFHL